MIAVAALITKFIRRFAYILLERKRGEPPFAVIVFRSVSLASRGVCVLLLFSAVSPRRFRAVPPRLCVVPFPRRAAASQLKKQQQRLLEAGRERQ